MIFYLYALSFLFLPFDYFIFQGQNIYGTTWTFSKIFQIITYVLIFSYTLIRRDLSILNNILSSLNHHKYFIFFFIFIILVSFFGFINGNYQYWETNTLSTIFSQKIALRPILEIFIFFHQYLFFIVLAPIIFDNKTKIRIFMKLFFYVILINLFMCFVDYGFRITFYDLIPRHLSDGRDVGQRLHGFFGEPRDAYVGLIFSMSFLYIYKNYLNEKIMLLYPIITIIALVLTGSTSLIVGSIMYLIFILFIKILNILNTFQLPLRTWFSLILITLALSIILIPRHYIYLFQIYEILINVGASFHLYELENLKFHILIKEYYNNFLENPIVYERDKLTTSALEKLIPSGSDRTGTGMSAHTVNILPFLEFLDRLKRFEILNFLFGTGSGTTSLFINNISNLKNVSNPHSLFIKILFEYGLIGLILLIFSLWKIILNLGKINNFKTNSILNGTYFLLLFPFMVNNNYMLYLFLGIAVILYQDRNIFTPKN